MQVHGETQMVISAVQIVVELSQFSLAAVHNDKNVINKAFVDKDVFLKRVWLWVTLRGVGKGNTSRNSGPSE